MFKKGILLFKVFSFSFFGKSVYVDRFGRVE